MNIYCGVALKLEIPYFVNSCGKRDKGEAFFGRLVVSYGVYEYVERVVLSVKLQSVKAGGFGGKAYGIIP